MKKRYKGKRKKPFIVIKIKLKFVKIVSEVCIATLIVGNLHTSEIKVENQSVEIINLCNTGRTIENDCCNSWL